MIVKVKIYYYSVFNKGDLSIEINEKNNSIMDVFFKLDHAFGNKFEKVTGRSLFDSLGTYFNVFLNGKYLDFPKNYNLKLSDNDTIILLHPVSGG
jgi:molybdopterin converting factor small subunit